MTSRNTKYRLGIVGCGTISAVHAEAIRCNDRAQLVSACSRTKENLGTFCNRFEIEGFTDYDEFLASNIDIVVLCTPNGTHLDYGLKAADAGKHVIVEKPIEITVDRGKKLIEYCKEKQVQLAVIYQNRFMEPVRKLKAILDTDIIGQLVMVRASVKWFRDQAYYQNAPWRGSLKLDGGGALINQSIHTVDLMLWLAGPVHSVQSYKATLTHDGIEGEDNFVAAMQFKNGALGVFEASTSIVPSQNRIIELHGTKGTVTLNGDNLEISADGYNPDHDASETQSNAVASGGSSGPMDGFSNSNHAEQYKQIFAQLDLGQQPPVSGEESMNALAFIQAAYQSAEQKAGVEPDHLYPFISSIKI